MELKDHIAAVPDFPRAGILFRDITPLLASAPAFACAVARFVAAAPPGVTQVAAVEARGFLFAPAVAAALTAGVAPIRKPGKLPRATWEESYALEYGQDKLCMHQDALAASDTVFLIDDLIATGGSLAAAARLIAKSGARLAKIACLIELADLQGRAALPAHVPFESLLRY